MKIATISKMQLFAAIGPLGAGKTTLTMNTIQALIAAGVTTKERCAYIINDEGASVDGSLIQHSAKVLAMTNGCFTCSDEAELKNTILQLDKEGMEWVFIEGFGITSGEETKKFLESCPYPFRIVCVLDYKHHERNIIRYADVIKSQIQTATIGIGITKYGDIDNLLELDDTVIDFVTELSNSKQLFLVPQNGSIPIDLLLASAQTKNVQKFGSFAATYGRSAHDAYDHAHHVHAMHTYSFVLRDETSFDDIRGAFRNCPDTILRIKGATSGKLFNAVFDDWKQTLPDTRSFVTFYALETISLATDLPLLAPHIIPDSESLDAKLKITPSYQLMRKEHASNEETIAAIEELLGEIPNEPVVVPIENGKMRIVTHPESLQILKEIARRPSIKEKYFPIALKHCMEYWIKCAVFIHENEVIIAKHEIATNKRELAVSLAWWETNYGTHFGSAINEKVSTLKLGEMVAQGTLALSSLNSDPERAYWQCQEILCAAKFGLSHDDDPALIKKSIEHGVILAQSTTVEGEWIKALQTIA